MKEVMKTPRNKSYHWSSSGLDVMQLHSISSAKCT
ncbi:hypothetical protein AWRI1631_100870 [Saccharomyces cerevisiae AWRI1631]|uniref:Uncharacterized protein n=1 Tax=Saccharomyces cerevisiae (strain AWRI1631) TaxID=545124 RepID=B5VL63_YEAS6|nr:hypothetical protein AWRI1631_100870 [Saccharomyces cerevisiae AWRI1631]